MASFFHNPAGIKIAVVDQRSTHRQAISDALRLEGANQITTFPDLKTMLNFAETEHLDWVLTGLRPDDEINALQLLNLCIEYPHLKNMRVSIFTNESDTELLPLAFELGLVSCHNGVMAGKFGEEIREFFRTVRENGANEQLIAARYLRQVIRERKSDPKHLVTLARNLLELHPGNTDILLNLAESQFLAGDSEAALTSLAQAKLIDPSREAQVSGIKKQFIDEDDSNTDVDGDFEQHEPLVDGKAQSAPINALGISCALVVDPDTTVQYAITQLLKGAGVKTVECFSRGDEAWDWIKAGRHPDLIIHEWKIPGLNGSLLLQRLRQKGLANVPIIVVSSLVGDDDRELLNELGASALLQKPFEPGGFFSHVIFALQQNHQPNEQVTLERKIRQFLNVGNLTEARKIAATYFSAEGFDEQARTAVAGEFAFADGDYPKAKALAIQSLRKGKDSLELLNLLGKTLMKMADFESAFKCFEKADALAPKNVERLCKMSIAQLESGNHEGAERQLEAAKAVDAGNQMVIETEASIAISKNDVERAKGCMQQVDSFSRILGFMNNKAVALVRHNKFEVGIDLYQCAIKSLPGEWSSTHDTVCYNLALAHVRYSNLEAALIELERIRANTSTPLGKKVSSLKKRVESSLLKGENLVLSDSTPTKPKSEPTLKAAVIAPSAETDAADIALPSTETPVNLALAPNHEKTADKEIVGTLGTNPEPRAATEDVGADYRELLTGIAAGRGELCLYRIFVAGDLLVARGIKLVTKKPEFRIRDAVSRAETFQVKPGAA